MPLPRTVEAFAPAKINLALHVTGRRFDGYHLLDSLVAFVAVADRLTLRQASRLSLRVSGPMAPGVPAGDDNLVLRAAAMLGRPVPAEIELEKHLPVAAGLGGGSSDAAAALLGLAALSDQPLPEGGTLLDLGADVPVCLSHAPRRMQGIGERLAAAPPLPPLHVVLVNPGVPIPTAMVYAGLESRENPGLRSLPIRFASAADFADWLGGQRNDLEAPARRHAPSIGDCLTALAAAHNCLLARMSGSGATCFGLFAAASDSAAAAGELVRLGRGWWVAEGPLLTGGDPVAPAHVTRATT